ncbi:hypothetical protein DM02DRAFT_546979 [Periconia macrospinosa]|uniref:Rhodopsin domain-containing protein n=1 Tax=Periconia macrospinosa TaxID=97972 RepID=A0A2V1D046_9PLEO|nr:hypothetical protein DM02DRAFT_546979 [Periconia macrospinosa]
MTSTHPDESRAGSVIANLAVSFGLVIITLALRLWARFQIMKSPGWDDLTAILATGCSLIGIIFNALYLRRGRAHHMHYLSELQRINTRGFLDVDMIPFLFGTAITKISIAFMVIRLTSKRWMKHCMYALIVSLVIVTCTCTIILFTYCPPTHAFWVFLIHSKCRPAMVLHFAFDIQAAWSVVTDLICTSTPLVMVWKLRMDLHKKIAITVLIGFALLITAGTGPESIIWTTLEQNTGLIAANLPPLRKFSRFVYEKILASSSIQYIISRSGGSASEKLSDNDVPTIGAARPRRSKDSDIELMRTENPGDFS